MIHLGDCLEVLPTLDAASIAAVVTDPPYGISFMGKHWDGAAIEERVGKRDVSKFGVRLTGGADSQSRKLRARTGSAFANRAGAAGDYDVSLRGNLAFQAWVEEWGSELLRILKPGGYALVFGGTRTYHRLASGLEDAGFEIRDTMAWLFGSGFPKSLNLDGEWDGWGTALKPAHEPIVVARKPLIGTVAANIGEHGTGALNIDGCRIGNDKSRGDRYNGKPPAGGDGEILAGPKQTEKWDVPLGRWPANVVLDEDAAAMLDEQSGQLVSGANPTRRGSDKFRTTYGDFEGQRECVPARGVDAGGASRFFYCPKVSKAERNAGLNGFPAVVADTSKGQNHHPTVKPIALMRWLVRLVAPPGGVVLDPFLGSGTTGIACALERFEFVGVEREADYLKIAEARIAHWAAQPQQLPLETA